MKLHPLTVPAGDVSFGLLAAAGLMSLRVTAGPLNPPSGSVSSTYKTLTEVEPRIAINSTNTPGDADSMYKITAAGSYYIVSDVTAPAGKSAIEVDFNVAPDVTIDLNGFTLRGATGSIHGISSSGFGHIEITNGSITGFGQDGAMLDCRDYRVERVSITNCLHGLVAGGQGSVSDCFFREVGGDALFSASVTHVERCIAWDCGSGILVAGDSVVTDCMALGSTYAGIGVGSNSTVRGCTAESNGAEGFGLGSHVSISGCVARSNQVGFLAGEGSVLEGCVSEGNTQHGFWTSDSSILRSCSATGNQLQGFYAGARTLFEHCSALTNASDGFRANVDATFINCVSTDNTADGFECADSSTFSGCTSNSNGGRGIFAYNAAKISGCSVNNNVGVGVFGNNGCHIENNLTRNNQQDGISVNFSCAVIGNNCNGDGAAAGTHGAIKVIGQANRVEGNNISYADRGLYLTSGGNAVIRNSVKGCTVNFDIVGGNDVGPIGSAATATSPWANIQY